MPKDMERTGQICVISESQYSGMANDRMHQFWLSSLKHKYINSYVPLIQLT